MTIFVVAEHDNASIKPATRNTVTAALEIDSDLTVLVVGMGCQAAATEAAAVAGALAGAASAVAAPPYFES